MSSKFIKGFEKTAGVGSVLKGVAKRGIGLAGGPLNAVMNAADVVGNGMSINDKMVKAQKGLL